MHTGPLRLRLLLRRLLGTTPFTEYCERRGIAFVQATGGTPRAEDVDRWQEAVGRLPPGERARVERELAQVHALRHPASLALLAEAARGRGLPPDAVPAGLPLALWFLLRHPDLVRAAFLQLELRDGASWRAVRAPRGIPIDVCVGRREALRESLRDFFQERDGTGRYCAVEAYRLADAACFAVRLSDRPRQLDVFTDDGAHTTVAARPAFSVAYVYDPAAGRILLRARRSAARALELAQRFGRAVLGAELGTGCLVPSFRLDLLKRRFDPPLDAPDMEQARVRTLLFAYPERAARRRVKLLTLPGDGQFAILELLHAHGGGEAVLADLDVLYAEIEVRLREDGRRVLHVVRLWPDRCNLGQGGLGDRLRACLRRWNIADADEPRVHPRPA